MAFIRAALLEHRVIFFRGQEHLDDSGQAGFARLFGDLTTAHPTVPGTGDAHVLELDAQRGGGKANAWHTDVTFVDRPPAISVLRAVTLPPYGGDTAWANTVAAYESLSPAPAVPGADPLGAALQRLRLRGAQWRRGHRGQVGARRAALP